MNLCTAGSILLVSMFLYSGSKKVLKLGNTEVDKLTAFKIPAKAAQALILAAGVFEVIASFIVIAHVTNLMKVSRKVFDLTLWSLVAFTVLVTLLFKFHPKFRPLAVSANIAVVGGLLAVLSCNKVR